MALIVVEFLFLRPDGHAYRVKEKFNHPCDILRYYSLQDFSKFRSRVRVIEIDDDGEERIIFTNRDII